MKSRPQVSLRIPEKVKTAYQVWCVKNGTTMTADIRKHIDKRVKGVEE